MTLSSPSPDEWKTIVSALALGMSFISLWFARMNWLQSNRPIVSAAVETHAGGNESIVYNLAVSNTGNRPAINVHLCADTSQVEKCMALWVQNFRATNTTYSHIMLCFSEDGEIPLLLNGKNMSNSFGYTRGDDQTFWLYGGASLPLTIRYSDLEGRRYCTSQVLIIKDSAFAGGMWEARENDS